MFNTLIGCVTRRKIISFVSLFALILSFGFQSSLNARTTTNKIEKNKQGIPAIPLNGPGQIGKWDTVYSFMSPVVASHVSVLPNGKLIAWGFAQDSSSQEIIQIWDPTVSCPAPPTPRPTECIPTTITLSSSYEDLACSGHSFLADGTLVVTGGQAIINTSNYPKGLTQAALYNFASGTNGTWSTVPTAMNGRRWYPTNLTLPSGGILVWGGFSENGAINNVPQILEKQVDGTYTWRTVNFKTPETDFGYYSWLANTSGGKVIDAVGLLSKSYLLGLGGAFLYPRDYIYKYPLNPSNSALDGSLTDYHEAGSMLVLDKDYYMVLGGAIYPKYTVETLKLSDTTPAWTRVGRMITPRRHFNSTILPDGKVLVTGGNKGDGFNNTCPQNAVKEAEMWDPATPGTSDQTGIWTAWASATQPRTYHSTAVLMPDGRVFTGGTTASWQPEGNETLGGSVPCTVNIQDNFTIEVFSPPYLFNSDGTPATRPEIGTVSTPVAYGQTINFTVTNAASGSKVSLVRLPSVTHSFNQSQGFTKLTPTISGQNFSVTIPVNRNDLVPGYYMMFVVNTAGVPSKAKIIQVL